MAGKVPLERMRELQERTLQALRENRDIQYVRHELLHAGLSEADADGMIEHARFLYARECPPPPPIEDKAEVREAANYTLYVGIVFFSGGMILTLATMWSARREGQAYLLMYGPIGAGLGLIGFGLREWIRSFFLK